MPVGLEAHCQGSWGLLCSQEHHVSYRLDPRHWRLPCSSRNHAVPVGLPSACCCHVHSRRHLCSQNHHLSQGLDPHQGWLPRSCWYQDVSQGLAFVLESPRSDLLWKFRLSHWLDPRRRRL